VDFGYAMRYVGCQSGAVVRSMFEINISAVTSEVVGSIPGQTIPHVIVIEWATLSDSVGFLRGLRFPPTYITNRPILSMELIIS
jgi:hypothetical protein